MTWKPTLLLDSHELAWAAGFFDGEGSVVLSERMADDELKEHLVAQHNCDAHYFRYGSAKSRIELHDDEHRPRVDRAVWKQGVPALTEPYDHSTHKH